MKIVRREIDRGHLGVGDAYTRRITTRIDFRSHADYWQGRIEQWETSD